MMMREKIKVNQREFIGWDDEIKILHGGMNCQPVPMRGRDGQGPGIRDNGFGITGREGKSSSSSFAAHSHQIKYRENHTSV